MGRKDIRSVLYLAGSILSLASISCFISSAVKEKKTVEAFENSEYYVQFVEEEKARLDGFYEETYLVAEENYKMGKITQKQFKDIKEEYEGGMEDLSNPAALLKKSDHALKKDLQTAKNLYIAGTVLVGAGVCLHITAAIDKIKEIS